MRKASAVLPSRLATSAGTEFRSDIVAMQRAKQDYLFRLAPFDKLFFDFVYLFQCDNPHLFTHYTKRAHNGISLHSRPRPDNFRERPDAKPHSGWCGWGRLITVPYAIVLSLLCLQPFDREDLFLKQTRFRVYTFSRRCTKNPPYQSQHNCNR
jgi:hypothetical protein